MREIFDSPKSPFFKSAISFGVERIDETAMADFLIERFKAGNRRIGRETVGAIMKAADPETAARELKQAFLNLG